MNEHFDPYHQWLGIPLSEQPANHYRLLGISAFEDSPGVIENAADQRMAHLRTFQAGKHSALSQKILNEMAAARVCLLNPAKKDEYDLRLRNLLYNAKDLQVSEADGLSAAFDDAVGEKNSRPTISEPSIRHASRAEEPSWVNCSPIPLPKRSRKKSNPGVFLTAGALIGVLLLGAILVSMNLAPTEEKIVARRDGSTRTEAPKIVGVAVNAPKKIAPKIERPGPEGGKSPSVVDAPKKIAPKTEKPVTSLAPKAPEPLLVETAILPAADSHVVKSIPAKRGTQVSTAASGISSARKAKNVEVAEDCAATLIAAIGNSKAEDSLVGELGVIAARKVSLTGTVTEISGKKISFDVEGLRGSGSGTCVLAVRPSFRAPADADIESLTVGSEVVFEGKFSTITKPCSICNGGGQRKCLRCKGKGAVAGPMVPTVVKFANGQRFTQMEKSKVACPVCGGSGMQVCEHNVPPEKEWYPFVKKTGLRVPQEAFAGVSYTKGMKAVFLCLRDLEICAVSANGRTIIGNAKTMSEEGDAPRANEGQSQTESALPPEADDGPARVGPLSMSQSGDPPKAKREVAQSPVDAFKPPAMPKPGPRPARQPEPKVEPKPEPRRAAQPEPEDKPKGKSPVPDSAAQRKSLATIRDIYKGDERATLPNKLIEKAKETQDATDRFVLLQEAKTIATETNQADLAFETIDAMASEYDIGGLEMKAEILERAAKKTRLTPDQKTAIADAALKMMDEAVSEDNFDIAKKLGKLASQLSRLSKDKDLLQETVAKSKEVDAAAKAYASVEEAMATLKETPTDPEANATVGKYLCLTKGNWEKGLPMLAKGSDANLSALAAKDIAGAGSGEEQVKLGDAWWNAGGKRRAVHWYEQALPGLTGLAKDRVEKRVEKRVGEGAANDPNAVVYLGDLEERDVHVENGWFRKNEKIGMTVNGKAIVHSLYTSPLPNGTASVSYQLDGHFKTFRCTAAIGDGAPTPTLLTFRVRGDGNVLWESHPMNKDNKTPQECRVSVGRVKVLTLEVSCPGSSMWAWATWIEPRLTAAKGKW